MLPNEHASVELAANATSLNNTAGRVQGRHQHDGVHELRDAPQRACILASATGALAALSESLDVLRCDHPRPVRKKRVKLRKLGEIARHTGRRQARQPGRIAILRNKVILLMP